MSKEFFDCIYKRGYGSLIEFMCIKYFIYTESILFEKNTFRKDFLQYILCDDKEEYNKNLLSLYIDRYKEELISTGAYYMIFEYDLCYVKILLSKINVNLYRGLKVSIKDANLAVVKYLLEELKVDIRDEIFYIAIISANSGKLDIIKYLYEKYNFKLTDELFVLSIMEDPSYYIEPDVSKFFLEQGYDPKNIKDKILTEIYYDSRFLPLQIVTMNDIFDFKIKNNLGDSIYVLCNDNSKLIFKFLIDECKAILLTEN